MTSTEEILVNVTPSETRVAIVENGMLQEILIERRRNLGFVGNIYQAQVKRVLPGMQAAFLDIGQDKAAFLHVADMDIPAEALDAIQNNGVGQYLREGQKLVVQVIKDPIGTKGARLSTRLSIPSRYLVLLPGQARAISVSARIEDTDTRENLKSMLEGLIQDDSNGYILRTNAEHASLEELSSDIRYLNKLWQSIQEGDQSATPGSCLYEDLSLSRRVIRDLLTTRVEKIRIDSRENYEKTLGFAQKYLPDWTDRITHYPGERPIFDLYGVEDEITRALERESPLKSGGYLVFDQTEAMTTIDVNTGGFVGKRNLEETIYKTNLEAAQAIARQLRLRNIGGIIIIDFIDMKDDEHKRHVLRTLERSLEKDHARTQISELSSLGLVEMTRKRTRESLEHILCEPCPHCGGLGSVKTAETASYEIFREILRAVRQFEAEQLLVMAARNVVNRILEEESGTVAELEEFIGKTIRFQAENHYSQDQYDVVLL